MSLLEKLMRTVKGVANDAVDATSDPARDARQIVRDLDEQIGKAAQAMLDVRAEHEVLKSKRDHQTEEVTKWVNAAKKAVTAGDDSLARECLAKKQTADTQLQSYQSELDKFEPTVKEINEHISQLHTQRESLESRTDIIAARSEIAHAQEKVAVVIGGIGKSSAMDDFNALEDKVLKQEARAHAATDVMNERTGASLDARVAALGNTSIDDELAALKAGK